MTVVRMRGTDEASSSLLFYVDLEKRIPAHHPLHKFRQVVNDALQRLNGDFDAVLRRLWSPLDCAGAVDSGQPDPYPVSIRF